MVTKIKTRIKKNKHNNYDSVVFVFITVINRQMEDYLSKDVFYSGKYKQTITMIGKKGIELEELYRKKGYITNSQKERAMDYANKFYRESREETEKKEIVNIEGAEIDEKFIPLIDLFMSSLEKYIEDFEDKIDIELLREIQIFTKYCRRFLINFIKLANGEER